MPLETRDGQTDFSPRAHLSSRSSCSITSWQRTPRVFLPLAGVRRGSVLPLSRGHDALSPSGAVVNLGLCCGLKRPRCGRRGSTEAAFKLARSYAGEQMRIVQFGAEREDLLKLA